MVDVTGTYRDSGREEPPRCPVHGVAKEQVYTHGIPAWICPRCWSPGMREVINAAAGLKEWRTGEIADRVSITERQVREHLHALRKRGYLEARHEGRGFTWRDTGLHRVSDHGEVDLEPINTVDLSENEVAEVTRKSIYTWEFRDLQPKYNGNTLCTQSNRGDTVVEAGQNPIEGDPPPR